MIKASGNLASSWPEEGYQGTSFFWGACFHTFLAGIDTFTYTLYTHMQVWVLAWDNMVDAHAQYHS